MGKSLKTDGTHRKKILISSILFMGLGHILFLKQYLKGFLFAAIEVAMLVFLPKIIAGVSNLITLGAAHPELPIKQRDNSIFMLIDGVIICGIIMIFLVIYVISVRSALAEYGEYCVSKEYKSNKNSVASIYGKSFPLVALTPALVMILFFVVVPLVFSTAVAFTNYSAPNNIPPNNTVDWVGIENFKAIFSGDNAWTGALGRVALWTVVWGVLATVTCYFGGLIIAAILHESKIKIKPFFRSIFILPYAVPSVVSMLVWKNLLNGSFGIVNRTLLDLGLIKDVIPWISDAWLAKFTCILINLWAGFPYFMLLVMGSMTAISSDVFEAAKVDGANRFQVFKGITLPLVLYQTTPLLIMSLSHNINNFGAIFFLTGGNPAVADTTTTSAGGTDLLITWIYKLTIVLMKYNYASVLAVMIFIFLAPFAIYNFRQTRAFKEGEV